MTRKEHTFKVVFQLSGITPFLETAHKVSASTAEDAIEKTRSRFKGAYNIRIESISGTLGKKQPEAINGEQS